MQSESMLANVKHVLDNTFFDVEGIASGQLVAEEAIKILTKIVVGACTLWWSIVEFVEYIRLRQAVKSGVYATQ